MPRAAVASRKQTARNGSGVPGPSKLPTRLGVRDGQKHLPDRLHTPAAEQRTGTKDRNKGKKERDRNIGAANGGKELNLARSSCCEVRSLLALLTLRSGSWLSGIRICTADFRRRIPIGDGLLCALSGLMPISWAMSVNRTKADVPCEKFVGVTGILERWHLRSGLHCQRAIVPASLSAFAFSFSAIPTN